jgi:putative ABC transport system substrate-binding protein
MAVIGLLGCSALDDYEPMIAAFLKGLSEAGYLEGKNVSFDRAWANDQYDRLPALASGLVGRQVSVILAASTPSAIAARSPTTTIHRQPSSFVRRIRFSGPINVPV